MLIKTTEEFKKYLSANAEFDFNALKPFIENQGEQVLIKKYLGDTLYADLVKAYSSGKMTAKMKELHAAVCLPLVNYAFLKYIPFGQVNISKSGINITSNESTKVAFEHQIKGIKEACNETVFTGIELLLQYLEKNKAETEFAGWLTSAGFTEFHELYLKTADEFHDIYNIDRSRRTFHALRSSMREVEDFKFKKLLGVEFTTELKTQQKAGNLTNDNKEVMKYIKNALAYLSIAKAAPRLPVKITADGLQMLSSSDRQTLDVRTPADKSSIAELIKDAEASGNAYLKDLEEYLYKNKDNYETWQVSSAYVDPTTTAAPDQSENGIVII